MRSVAPARVVTIHQAADLLDYDGPGEALARAMAAASPLPVERLGSRPGSLGSWVGLDLEVPIVTVELPRSADALDAEGSWELYGAMLVEALRFEPGSLPAEDLQGDGEGQRAP